MEGPSTFPTPSLCHGSTHQEGMEPLGGASASRAERWEASSCRITADSRSPSHSAIRKGALVLLAGCAVMCVVALLGESDGSRVELDVSSSIARALEQAQRDSEHSEHSSGHYHEHTQDHAATTIRDETRGAEDWSGAKLRRMVGRLFKAMASLDHRVTRKYDDLDHKILTSSKLGMTRHQVQQMMTTTRNEVEESVQEASKQLSSVRKGELTMKKLISVQSKLSEQQHRQSEEKLQELRNQGERLRNMALKDRDVMRRTQDEQLEEADGSEGPAMLQTLQALGLQSMLDNWCNNPHNCKLAGKSRLYARKSESKNSRVPGWRCYSEESLTHDLIHYNGGESYCTSDEHLRQLLKSHVGAHLDDQEQNELAKVQSLESTLKRVEKQEAKVADRERDDQQKLSVVGPDLNYLYSKMSTDKKVENSTAHQELLDTHALATLDHRIGTISKKLQDVNEAIKDVRKENQDEVVHGDKEVVQKISAKVQKTMASTAGQIEGLNSRLKQYENQQSTATNKLQAEMAEEGKKEDEHRQLVVTLVGDKVERVAESGVKPASPGANQQLSSAPLPSHPSPAMHAAPADVAAKLPHRASHQGSNSQPKEHAQKKEEHAHKKKPSGCLIHLSGVVQGLNADNSIEC